MSSLVQLQELIHTKYGIEPSALGPDGSFTEHGIDSLVLVEFVYEVEQLFQITLDDRKEIDTLVALARAVDELRASQRV